MLRDELLVDWQEVCLNLFSDPYMIHKTGPLFVQGRNWFWLVMFAELKINASFAEQKCLFMWSHEDIQAEGKTGDQGGRF